MDSSQIENSEFHVRHFCNKFTLLTRKRWLLIAFVQNFIYKHRSLLRWPSHIPNNDQILLSAKWSSWFPPPLPLSSAPSPSSLWLSSLAYSFSEKRRRRSVLASLTEHLSLSISYHSLVCPVVHISGIPSLPIMPPKQYRNSVDRYQARYSNFPPISIDSK